MRVLTKTEIRGAAELIGRDQFCADIAKIAFDEHRWLSPPREISTLQYSIEYRRIRQADGTSAPWSRALTPYLAPIMAALDNPLVREVIVAKPARSGGTVVAENYALKTMEFGPPGDIMWYLAGPQEVDSYASRVFKPMFEDHEGVAAKIGSGPSDNNLKFKRIGGYTVELLPMSAKTTTNRQARLIVFDEPDSYVKKFASNFMEQGRQRQRMIGNLAKIYACAHPDIGWSGGIAQAWLQSSRGIFIMACAECGGHASPYPTKHWPEIERFRLHYEKSPDRTPVGERLNRAERTAAMLCPHCGALLDDDQRREMVAKGQYLHAGQGLDTDLGIIGEPEQNRSMGFWIHALMVWQVTISELARELEGAVEHRERTGKTEKVKQVMVRTFGEAYEGAGDTEGLDAALLKKRTRDLADDRQDDAPMRYRMGQAPDGVMFITASVDPGGNKFDVLLHGWDLERRSWLIDRFTIRQRTHNDGVMRDIRPAKVADDWMVLEGQVIDRLIPLRSDPTRALPVAVTLIDSGDGNVTWNAYEFARRMDRKRWLDWRRVRCIKGASGNRPHLSPMPAKISKDAEGKAVTPIVTLHTLGVDGLKEEAHANLAISDGSPGQCFFAINTPADAFDEFFGEALVEGKWLRSGPNETLDLYGYSEAGRLMLEPDRKDRIWQPHEKRPPWARAVSLIEEISSLSSPGTPAAPAKRSVLSRFEQLNKE